MRPLPKGSATVGAGRALTISVVVPTYRRPDDLRRCLEALIHQVPAPGSVVIVVREGDTKSAQIVADVTASGAIRVVRVGRPGVIAAVAEGIGNCDTDIVATTDDDAIPRPGWVAALLDSYRDDTVGGVGGPDLMHVDGRPVDGAADTVGQVTRFGRLIGNHHLGWRYAGDVDVLKGVNMSLRKHLWVLDRRLRGEASQHLHSAMSGRTPRQFAAIFAPGERGERGERRTAQFDRPSDVETHLVTCRRAATGAMISASLR